MDDVKFGDEVRVYDLHRTSSDPDGGWPGEVIKVFPSVIWVRYDGTAKGFRSDDRAANDAFGGLWFRTTSEGFAPEAVAEDRQRRAASPGRDQSWHI